MRLLTEQNRILMDAERVDAGAGGSGDDEKDTWIADLDEEKPHWHGQGRPIDDEILAKALICQKKGFHRVGNKFLIDLDGQGPDICYWDWFAAVRGRGMNQFGIRCEYLPDKRPRARFKWYKNGKSCCNVRGVCLHCRSMVMFTSPGGGQFTQEQDEAMCKYFMVEPLAHPSCMVR